MMTRNFALNPVTVGLNNNAVYEPQRTNHFEVYIFLPAALYAGDAEKTEQARKYITMATTDFSLPNISTTPIEIPYGNTKIKLAGTVEYGGADSLTCIDFVGADTEGILYNWQNLVSNPETGQIGWAATYKTDAKVLEYSGDGQCLASWVLRGVWPSGIEYGSGLSKASSDIKNLSVTLSYDVAYRKYGDSSRNTYEEAVANSASNMTWKSQDQYAATNPGGPITAIKDDIQ